MDLTGLPAADRPGISGALLHPAWSGFGLVLDDADSDRPSRFASTNSPEWMPGGRTHRSQQFTADFGRPRRFPT